jgi:hypothetical protein
MGPGQVSVSICGTIGGQVIIIVPGGGVVDLNGKLQDPLYILSDRYTPFYFWDLRRRFDKYEQFPLIDSMLFVPVPIVDERAGQ